MFPVFAYSFANAVNKAKEKIEASCFTAFSCNTYKPGSKICVKNTPRYDLSCSIAGFVCNIFDTIYYYIVK